MSHNRYLYSMYESIHQYCITLTIHMLGHILVLVETYDLIFSI